MKNAIAFISIALFILSLVVLSVPKEKLLQRFSPQARVNPNTIKEEFDSSASQAIYDNNYISIPSSNNLALLNNLLHKNVLSASNLQKRIEVDLTNQRLYAYEGPAKVFDFLISSGKWGRTPTGIFEIWIKLKSTKMEGGSKDLGTYYYLPNVPYVMYFYNDEIPKWRGFGLHGTYWHNNFGHPMSHGCVNMKTEEVEQLFYWAQPDLQGKTSIYASDENPGTPVIIYGEAPNE